MLRQGTLLSSHLKANLTALVLWCTFAFLASNATIYPLLTLLVSPQFSRKQQQTSGADSNQIGILATTSPVQQCDNPTS
jgi:hypothetical protein